MRRWNTCFAAGFVTLAVLSSSAWADNFGVWASADMHTNIGNAQIPTAYGYSQGDHSIYIGPLGPGSDASGFGTYNASNNSYAQILNGNGGVEVQTFTPYSYYVNAAAFFAGQAGNLEITGTYDELIDTVTFQLDQATAYSITNAGIDSVYPPELKGPGGQTITITGAMSGTLAAGDWIVSMDIMGLTPSDYSNGVYDGAHQNYFLLTVPEPAGMLGLVIVGLAWGSGRKIR